MSTDSNVTAQQGIAVGPTADSSGSGGDRVTTFLRLPDDGDAAIVAFLGSPHLHAVTWDSTRHGAGNANTSRPVIRCQHRIAINVAVCELVRVNRQPSMRFVDVRVWEHSRRVYSQVLTLTRTFRATDWLFLIERQGKPYAKDTVYAILPVYALTEEDRQLLRLPHRDLNALFGPDARGGQQAGPERIDAAELSLLKSDLNRLPDPVSAMRAFCLHFRVHRIEKLPKADLPEARVYLARLSGEVSNPFE